MQKQTLVDERTVELGDATSVAALVQMGSGELKIAGGAASLLAGRFEYGAPGWKPEVDYSVEDGRGSLTVKPPAERPARDTDAAYHWDLAFGDEIPLDLALQLGSGKAALNLGGTALRTLDSAVGSGEFAADLAGGMDLLSDAALRVASGRTTMVLSGVYPALEKLRIESASGLVDLALGGRYEGLRRLTVRGASGDINLGMTGDYPALEGLAVDTASGTVDINFGDRLEQDLSARINCVSGRVIVRYPPEGGVSVRFTSVTGKVDAPGLRKEGNRYVNKAYGQAEFDLELSVSSVSGKLILQPCGA
ncbi:MAG: toast rack family protein [Anaerolineae bacterium]